MNTTTVGSMSQAELEFCNEIRNLFQVTLEGRTPFGFTAAKLLADLRTVVRKDWDVTAANEVAGLLLALDAVPPRPRLTPTDAESSFLRDANAFVEFSLRNGLTFDTVASVLMHDLSEIAIHGFKLDAAITDGCFRPKITGWAKRNQESSVAADEPVE